MYKMQSRAINLLSQNHSENQMSEQKKMSIIIIIKTHKNNLEDKDAESEKIEKLKIFRYIFYNILP